MRPKMKKRYRSIKTLFCKHAYQDDWSCSFEKLDVTFYKTCPKCGQTVEIKMKLKDVTPAVERIRLLRKNNILV